MKGDMKEDLFKLIDYISFEEYKFNKFYMYPSIFLPNPNDFRDNLHKAVENEEYKIKILSTKIDKKYIEELKIVNNEILWNDGMKLDHKIAIGYLVLIFEKNQ